jgi:hypothetical protein
LTEQAAVDELVAKQAIHDVVMRYCRGIDRLDEELVRSVYHPDAYDDHGTFKGNGWDFASSVIQTLAAVPQRTMHTICNELVEVDNDVAYGEAYVVAHHLFDDGAGGRTLFSFHGRYVDRFERRDDEWNIAHRVVVKDWAESRPFTETWADDSPFSTGVRSRDDHAYGRTAAGSGAIAASAPTAPAT